MHISSCVKTFQISSHEKRPSELTNHSTDYINFFIMATNSLIISTGWIVLKIFNSAGKKKSTPEEDMSSFQKNRLKRNNFPFGECMLLSTDYKTVQVLVFAPYLKLQIVSKFIIISFLCA